MLVLLLLICCCPSCFALAFVVVVSLIDYAAKYAICCLVNLVVCFLPNPMLLSTDFSSSSVVFMVLFVFVLPFVVESVFSQACKWHSKFKNVPPQSSFQVLFGVVARDGQWAENAGQSMGHG